MAPFLSLGLIILVFSFGTILCEKCPNPSDIQDPWVTANFSMNSFLGNYYEIAYHDYTQPNFCSCQRAFKHLPQPDGPLHDNFTIECFGGVYPNDLVFNLTEKKGVFNGLWSFVPGVVFPNTVVDVGHRVDPATNEIVYDWALEFQCVEIAGAVAFVGVNYYSRDDSQRDFAALNASAYNHGLWPYIKPGLGLKIIDRSKCKYGETEFSE